MIWSQDENISCFSLLFSLILYKGWFSVCKNHDKSKITQNLSRIKEINFFFFWNSSVIRNYTVTSAMFFLRVQVPHARRVAQLLPARSYSVYISSLGVGVLWREKANHSAPLPLLILITLLLNGSGTCVSNGPGEWRHRERREMKMDLCEENHTW